MEVAVEMAGNQSVKGNFHYNNIEKKDKNFMYQNLQRSNCYNSDFSNSNFDYVSFKGAHFKSCRFLQCTFRWAEFIGTNLKGSNMSDAVFENTIFDSANLDGVNFKDAKFNNTIFLSTDIEKAKNLDSKNPNIKIFHEMPQLEISAELAKTVENVMKNEYVKKARVFDTKEGTFNLLNIMILLDIFDEETLIKGLNIIAVQLDRAFYTLSYVIKLIKKYKAEGTL
jgi:Uncharacterized low-complexity proteins